MIIFERLGGWGLANSLFQIAATVSIANFNNTTYAFPDNCSFRFSRYAPGDSSRVLFKRELPWINFSEAIKEEHEFWGFGSVGFKPLPKTDKLLLIDGFFQSEKYFKSCRSELIELFELKEQHKQYIKTKYSELIKMDSCALHVRRGDYATARELIILDIEYYKKATESIGKDRHFVIFSDDIAWCKANFEFLPNKSFVEERNDLLELYLMSLFRNHIIANSTFSWWGAWMANESDVIMPNPKTNWFSEAYYDSTKNISTYEDMICENWRVI